MEDDFGWEEILNESVKDIRAFINTENQFIEEEHGLVYKLGLLVNIIGYLDEQIPENLTQYHTLIGEITDIIIQMGDSIESGRLKDLKFEKEEIDIMHKLEDDVKHRDWKAVKKDVEMEEEEQEKVIKLQFQELRELHTKFLKLMKLMKRSNLIAAINEDLTVVKGKEQYVQETEYYFVQIYKFCRAYERIFRHLWKKEIQLNRQLENKKI